MSVKYDTIPTLIEDAKGMIDAGDKVLNSLEGFQGDSRIIQARVGHATALYASAQARFALATWKAAR